MWDDTLNHIRTFVVNFLTATQRAERESQRAVRDLFHFEVQGFSEFIAVNGRMYRYGFISSDTVRTRSLARAIFNDNFGEFERTVGHISDVDGWDDLHISDVDVDRWDNLRPPELKRHLLKHVTAALALQSHLPPPLLHVNTHAREWLHGVYENITRLNSDWGTEFETWDDVVVSDTERERDAVKSATSKDMADIRGMLRDTTQNALMQTPSVEADVDAMMSHVRTRLPALHAAFPHQGQAELIMATLAAFTTSIPTFYAILLLYLAKSTNKHHFCKMPQGAQIFTSRELAADRATFLENHYDTEARSVQSDWASAMEVHGPSDEPLNVLVSLIPVSTIKDVRQFASLATSITRHLQK